MTQELPENPGTHAAKHGRKAPTLEIDGSEARITLSPAVLEAIQSLHSCTVRYRELARSPNRLVPGDFDPEQHFRELAYAKPVSAQEALLYLATGFADAAKCYNKTGGRRIIDAMDEVVAALGAKDGKAPPVMLTVESKAKGR